MSHPASACFNSSLLCMQRSMALTLPVASNMLKMSRFGLKWPPNGMWHVLWGGCLASSTLSIYTHNLDLFVQTTILPYFSSHSGFFSRSISRILPCRNSNTWATSCKPLMQLQRLNPSLWKSAKFVYRGFALWHERWMHLPPGVFSLSKETHYCMFCEADTHRGSCSWQMLDSL